MPRNLTSRINARAQELVNIELVHIKKAISDDEIVDVNAQQQKVTILTEQLNISRARRIVIQLLDELEDQVMNREFCENLGEMIGPLDESGHDKLNDL